MSSNRLLKELFVIHNSFRREQFYKSGCGLNYSRMFIVSIVLLCTFVLLPASHTHLFANEVEVLSAQSERFLIVPVPNNFSPQNNYKPIKKDDFNALWNNFTKNVTSQSRIKVATYQAHFEQNGFKNGTFSFDVVSSDNKLSQLILSPLNIHLSDLRWDEEPAIWGTTPSHKTAVLIPQPGKLSGSWQVLNQQQDHKLRYSLQFPDAAITKLELIAPNNVVLDSDHGVVRSAPSKREGYTAWSISLGNVSSCKISISPKQLKTNSRMSLSSEEFHSYSIKQEKLSLTSKFKIHSTAASLSHLDFLTPPHLNIVSVKYAGIDNLHWEQISNEESKTNKKQIRILFSENLKGLDHSIVINAVGTLRSASTSNKTSLVTLPKINLDDSFISKSIWELQINKPLELQDFTANNLQLISITEDPNLTQFLKFQPLLANQEGTSLAIELGWPKASTEVSQICFVEREGTEWLLTSEIEINTQQGTLYEYDFRIPPNWDIVNVKEDLNSTSTGSTLQWHNEDEGSTNKRLKLVFSNGLSESFSKKIYITARRQLSHAQTELSLPFFKPLVGNLTTLLVFAPTSVTSSTANSRTSDVREIIPNDLPDEFLDFDLVSEGRFYRDGFRILHILNTNEIPSLQINIPEQLLDITVNSQIHIHEATTEEKVVIKLAPQGGSVSEFYVYSPSVSNFYTFSSPVVPLTKQPIPIPISHVPFWNLPEYGQLWKIPLESAQTKPFELILERSHSTPQFLSQMLPLVYLPGTSNFTGTVSVWNSSSQVPAVYSSTRARLEPGHLKPIQQADGTTETPVSFCNYLSPHNQYTFSLEEKSKNQRSYLGCRLALTTHIGESPDSPQQYEAKYELPLIKDQKFIKLEWPENLKIVSIHLHDSKFAIPSGKREFEIQLDQFETGRDLVIRYHAQIENTGFLTRNFGVVIPQLSIPIVDFHWTIHTPNSEIIEVNSSNGHSLEFHNHSTDEFLSSSSPSRNNKTPSSLTETTTVQLYHLPSELKFTTGNIVRNQIIGCLSLVVSFLFAFYTRVFSKSTQNIICSVLILFSFCVNIFVPQWLNALVHCLSSGLILGWIMSVSLRKFNRGLLVNENPEYQVPLGSTKAYPVVRIVTWFLVSSLFSNGVSLADDTVKLAPQQLSPTTKQAEPSQASNIYELPSQDILYIPTQLYSKLNQSDESHVTPTSSWIQNADYRLEIDPNNGTQLTARFQIIVPTTKKSFDLLIPFDSSPSLDSCLVEGTPHTEITKTESGYKILLPESTLKTELSASDDSTTKNASVPQFNTPGFRKLQIDLIVFPATTLVDETAYEISLKVPPVSDSQLAIQSATSYEFFYVNSRPLKPTVGEERLYSTHLENTNNLRIKWANRTVAETQPFSINRQTCIANLQTSEVQLHYAIDYSWNKSVQPTSKTIHSFHWLVPTELVLHRLSFNKSSINLNEVSIQQYDGFSEYEFEASISNSSQPPVIEAFFSRPITDKIVSVPAINVLNARSNVSSFHVGITKEPNLHFSPQNSGTYKSIPNDAIETIFPQINSSRPQVVYQVPTSEKLILSVTAPKNILNIENRYKIEVSSDGIHWTSRFTITPTLPLPQYLHRLVIPKNLKIDSVKVFENTTNRLGHWSRNGEKLNIFLNNSIQKEHEIELDGTFNFTLERQLDIPLVSFKSHPIQNQTFRIIGTNSLDVRPSNLNRSGNVASPLLGSRPNERLIGSFSLQEGNTPQITVHKIKENSPLKAISRIRRSSANNYSVDISILVPRQFTQDNLILSLPTSFDPTNSKIQVSPNLDHKLVYNIKNQPRLQIPLTTNQETASELNFSITLPIPSEKTWTFEAISLPGNQPIQNYVYFKNQDLLIQSLNGINEVDSEQIQQDPFLSQSAIPGEEIYQLANGIKKFEISTNAQKENHTTQVSFQHIDVKLSSPNKLLGKTTLFCENTELHQLNFYWAEGYRLRSATLNSQSVSDSTIQSAELSFLAPAGMNFITLNWEIPLEQNKFGFSRTIPQLPLVKSHAGNSSLFTLNSPYSFIRIDGLSLKNIDQQNYMLTRLENLMHSWKHAQNHEEANKFLAEIVGYYQYLKSTPISSKYLTRFKKLEIQYRDTIPSTEGVSPALPAIAHSYLRLEPSVAGYRVTFTTFELSTPIRISMILFLTIGGLLLYRHLTHKEWFALFKEKYTFTLSLILAGVIWWQYWIFPTLGLALIGGATARLLYEIGKQFFHKYNGTKQAVG